MGMSYQEDSEIPAFSPAHCEGGRRDRAGKTPAAMMDAGSQDMRQGFRV